MTTNIAWILLSVMLGAVPRECQAPTPAPDLQTRGYRILDFQTGTQFAATYEYYWISVDKGLSGEEFKRLVCQIVKNEKAGGRDRMIIRVYYRVKNHMDPENFESIKNMIGEYVFNAKLGPEKRVALFQDESVTRYKSGAKFVSFDHRMDCQ